MELVTNTSSSTFEPVPIEWVEKLFAVMTACYGVKFLDMWRGVDMDAVKTQWAAEMGKLSRFEIKRGHAALMTRETPPTLPQFLKLCKPNMDPEAAFYEAVAGMQARERGDMGEWSSPAIYWAAVKVGAYEMRTQTYAVLATRWKTALETFSTGRPCADIPKPTLSLPEPGKGTLSRESAARMLAELKANGIVKSAAGPSRVKTDHLLWAKRIVRRVAEGDKTVSHIQKQFATEALKQAGAA